jgi:lysyl-tRNA synthetase class 2
MREQLLLRARLNHCVRDFFAARDVLEVETPILSVAGTTDPVIESFVTHYAYGDQALDGPRWLRTSPEFFHKRLLAAGSGAIYELGRVFRNGELSARHNPEFSLLEWYRPGFGECELMAEVEALVGACATAFGRVLPVVERLSFAELFRRHAGLDPFVVSDSDLAHYVERLGLIGQLDRDAALDMLRTHVIEPALDPQAALFVTDFPVTQAALARIKLGDPPTAARFEMYLGRLELANGYHELSNSMEQRTRFAADVRRRYELGQPVVGVDQHFLAALDAGLPDCSGVALGVDRLLMWLLGSSRIEDVLAFGFARS